MSFQFLLKMKRLLNSENTIFVVGLLLVFGTIIIPNKREISLSSSVPEIASTREAKILTAYFGLDNALPLQAIFIHKDAVGKDGMPMVLSLEVDPSTVDASDFEITSKDGTVYGVEAATLFPAEEAFELRTIVLIGEYGNYPDNPPVSVKIVGDLKGRTGKSFKGQYTEVIPLEEGPILSYAEYFTFTENYPYVERGVGCDCPRGETQMIVKVVWSGGVRAINGEELGENELNYFEVTMVRGLDTLVVNPFLFADLNDNDNNIDLCLDEVGIPISVRVNESAVIDPRGDKNSENELEVMSRW